MSKNDNLHKAKTAKNDEFYTLLPDIEKELRHYKAHFRDKTVFCNCDDPMESNFWQYFSLNFDRLQLKRLVATHYETDKPSYMLEMCRDDAGVHTNIKPLRQNGDFRSPECIELLQQADIVVTNPMFSLWREYIAQLMQYDKKFVIIGNTNAVTYKEFFPLIKANKVWAGFSFNKTMEFIMPDSYELKGKAYIDDNGKKHGFVPAIAWYTNLDIKKRHEPLILCKRYDPALYPTYDNYAAINCDKVADIPMDYCESWGVPTADLSRLAVSEWEVVRTSVEDGVDTSWIIPVIGTPLRQILSAHADGYRETIESVLNTALYCNGEIGAPITVMDALSPEQFDIVGADYNLAQPQLLDNGKLGTGRFYVTPESAETTHTHTQAAVQQNRHQTQAVRYCNGIMGVPITFLDAFNPTQFVMLGIMNTGELNPGIRLPNTPHGRPIINGMEKYLRVLIQSAIATA